MQSRPQESQSFRWDLNNVSKCEHFSTTYLSDAIDQFIQFSPRKYSMQVCECRYILQRKLFSSTTLMEQSFAESRAEQGLVFPKASQT